MIRIQVEAKVFEGIRIVATAIAKNPDPGHDMRKRKMVPIRRRR